MCFHERGVFACACVAAGLILSCLFIFLQQAAALCFGSAGQVVEGGAFVKDSLKQLSKESDLQASAILTRVATVSPLVQSTVYSRGTCPCSVLLIKEGAVLLVEMATLVASLLKRVSALVTKTSVQNRALTFLGAVQVKNSMHIANLQSPMYGLTEIVAPLCSSHVSVIIACHRRLWSARHSGRTKRQLVKRLDTFNVFDLGKVRVLLLNWVSLAETERSTPVSFMGPFSCAELACA